MRYKSTRRFDCAYNNKLYAIGSSEKIVLETEATSTEIPREKVLHPENQEVLKFLYEIGHSGVVVDTEKKQSSQDKKNNQETEEQ